MLLHTKLTKAEREAKTRELINAAGLQAEQFNRYPHALSGGQRQRVGIARAIAINPRLIIADEPVSSLHVSIRVQILNLFKDIQAQFALTYIFISHDLSVVKYISERIAVMYLERVVELAPSEKIYDNPLHPYAKLLIAAIPAIGKAPIRNAFIANDEEAAGKNISASSCLFASRCAQRLPVCLGERAGIAKVCRRTFCGVPFGIVTRVTYKGYGVSQTYGRDRARPSTANLFAKDIF